MGADEVGDLEDGWAEDFTGVAATFGLEEGMDLGTEVGVDLTGVGATRGEADPFQERLMD